MTGTPKTPCRTCGRLVNMNLSAQHRKDCQNDEPSHIGVDDHEEESGSSTETTHRSKIKFSEDGERQ